MTNKIETLIENKDLPWLKELETKYKYLIEVVSNDLHNIIENNIEAKERKLLWHSLIVEIWLTKREVVRAINAIEWIKPD